jgi:predicted nucleic acid-binding protein
VTRYLLDTNIISNVVKQRPSKSLLAWMAAQHDEHLFISSLTLAEIRRGIFAARRRADPTCVQLGRQRSHCPNPRCLKLPD